MNCKPHESAWIKAPGPVSYVGRIVQVDELYGHHLLCTVPGPMWWVIPQGWVPDMLDALDPRGRFLYPDLLLRPIRDPGLADDETLTWAGLPAPLITEPEAV